MALGKRKYGGGYSSGKRFKRAWRKKKSPYKKRKFRGALGRAIKNTMLSQCETKYKDSDITTTAKANLGHNQMTIIKTNILDVDQGDQVNLREGRSVWAKGVCFKMFLFNRPEHGRVTYMFYLFRNRYDPADAVSTGMTDIFEGVSNTHQPDVSTRQLAWLDTKKYEFKMIKKVVVDHPNHGVATGSGKGENFYGDDVVYEESATDSLETLVQGGTKLLKFWWPFRKTINYAKQGAGAPIRDIWNFGCIAYGSHGATTASTIVGQYRASMRFYFKDP